MTSATERHLPSVKRILVATDYSDAARLALRRAGQLAKQHGAYLHVIHAQPDWNLFSQLSPTAAKHYHAVVDHAEGALRREIASLESDFGVQARGENRVGRASQVLHAVTSEIEPHLIVAGARGEHTSARGVPFLGGTALKLIAYSPCPTLIVRAADGPYRLALAAIESSANGGSRLVRWAQALLEQGECHVVHAFSAPYVERMRAHGIPEATIRACNSEVGQAAQEIVDGVLSAAGQTKVRMHAHLINGEPVAALLEEIERRKPEVVVLGKHQHPPRERHLSALGSVAMRIAYHAPCDVLIVP